MIVIIFNTECCEEKNETRITSKKKLTYIFKLIVRSYETKEKYTKRGNNS